MHACAARPKFDAVGCGFKLAFLVLDHRAHAHIHKLREPVVAKFVFEGIQRGWRRFLEVQRFGELEDVFGGDVFVADLEREIGGAAARYWCPLPTRPTGLWTEICSSGLPRLVRCRTMRCRCRIRCACQNECGSAVVIDQTRQDHARQEGFARAGSAKNAR